MNFGEYQHLFSPEYAYEWLSLRHHLSANALLNPLANCPEKESLQIESAGVSYLYRSRLGCQVQVKKWMDGLTVQVPLDVSDIRRELGVEKQGKQ